MSRHVGLIDSGNATKLYTGRTDRCTQWFWDEKGPECRGHAAVLLPQRQQTALQCWQDRVAEAHMRHSHAPVCVSESVCWQAVCKGLLRMPGSDGQQPEGQSWQTHRINQIPGSDGIRPSTCNLRTGLHQSTPLYHTACRTRDLTRPSFFTEGTEQLRTTWG